MRIDAVQTYKELFLENLDNFPSVMMNNDLNTHWNVGSTYTFNVQGGQVIIYTNAVVCYQILDVIYVHEDGSKEKISETGYTLFLEEGDLYEEIKKYGESPDYYDAILNQALSQAIYEKIEEFSNDAYIGGCYFVANRDNLLLTEDEIYDEILEIFQMKLESFYIDLLMKKEFEPGKYRLTIEAVDIGYNEGKEYGWGVLVVVGVQNYQTLNTEKIQFIYHTGVPESGKDPIIGDLKEGAAEVVSNFKSRKPTWEEFGISFSFKSKPTPQDQYKDIKGEKEDTDRWAERFVTVLENHRDNIKNYVESVDVLDDVGFVMVFRGGFQLTFGALGIQREEGINVYIKNDMNLQEGLGQLATILGKNQLTIDIIKTYDYRTKLKENNNQPQKPRGNKRQRKKKNGRG